MITATVSPSSSLSPTSDGKMFCVEIRNPTAEQHAFLRMVMSIRDPRHPAHALRRRSGAFLQCDDPGYVLIEFWTGDQADYQPFIDWLNQNLP